MGLPLAVFWGWMVWAELPDLWVSSGIFLIMGSGLFVFLREAMLKRRIASGRRVNRRY